MMMALPARANSAMWPLLRQFWKPIVALLGVAIAALAAHHYGAERYRDGYQQALTEDAAALAKQVHDAQIKETDDALRLQKAASDLESTRRELGALRAQPVHHVVCRAAPNPGRVPEAARIPDTVVASAGTFQGAAEQGAQSFDPTDALIAIADEADEVLASCRYLHQAVHGIPSTQPARIP